MGDRGKDPYGKLLGASAQPRDIYIQLLVSLALGIGAFLTFCALRPRWSGLYAARKRRSDAKASIPDLPSTVFGWIVPLWKITDQQVLISAGLDAYVFLAFFKLAIKFLLVALFFALVVFKPVHDAFPEGDPNTNGTHGGNSTIYYAGRLHAQGSIDLSTFGLNGTYPVPFFPENLETDYLWMYVVFAYVFSAIAIYLVISETRRVIEVRQEYLGAKHTVTDRTLRLSGIPIDLQDEGRIKDFMEGLAISGKVEHVTLCRNWKELDSAMTARMDTLRRLEEAYTIAALPNTGSSLPYREATGQSEAADESLVSLEDGDEETLLVENPPRPRPMAVVRYGWLGLKRRKVDAIDHYEEQLDEADQRLSRLREKEFRPMPLAFVTMDSVAACQMAIQAVLNPSPLQLIANQAPAPADVIWPNTYLSRRNRMIRSWSITALIVLLTVFWSGILVPVAGLLNVDTIKQVFPQLAPYLKTHSNLRSLINTQVPTLLASLITVAVPYLYYYLSWLQGEISQGEIELSSISKNFFFTFFNFFVVFTILGTISNFVALFEKFGDIVTNFQNVAHTLATSLSALRFFYANFVILQGIGLFPFRLLEVGSMSLYPIYRLGAKTPRDYAELVQPPVFSYGFYLPSALLIFVICLVYSVLRNSWQVLLAGLAYFVLGHFVYKYQLLYAMDHRQQATGRAWGMICDRIFVGLVFFQVTMAGQLIANKAIARSVVMVPLVMATVWINVMYGRSYKPLMRYIALSSVRERGAAYSDRAAEPSSRVGTDNDVERNVWADSQSEEEMPAPDRDDETEGLSYVPPFLIAPLKGAWINGHLARGEGEAGDDGGVGRAENV